MKLCLLKKVVLIKDLTPKTVFLDVSSQNAVYKRGRGGTRSFLCFSLYQSSLAPAPKRARVFSYILEYSYTILVGTPIFCWYHSMK